MHINGDIIETFGMHSSRDIDKFSKDWFDSIDGIKVIRDGYDSVLSKKEQKHLTEVALDEYNSYDYVIHNDGTLEDLKEKVFELMRRCEDER